MKIIDLVKSRSTRTLLKNHDQTISQIHDDLLVDPKEKVYSIIRPKNINIPIEFNGKEIWKSFLSEILNQEECGSCWAFASVSSLSDRYNILSQGKIKITLSPVPLLICDTFGYKLPTSTDYPELTVKIESKITSQFGCHGNTLAEAWRYLYTLGTSTIECLPVSLIGTDYLPSCVDILSPTYDLCEGVFVNYPKRQEYAKLIKYYSCFYFYSLENDPLDICREIYIWGPVSTSMEVYENFYTFDPKTEIYKWDKKGKLIFGHAVVLSGWGIENGIPFWWVRNSWGPNWGIDGYFKILRGNNECRIEEHVIAGLPNINLKSIQEIKTIQNIDHDTRHKFYHYSQNNISGGVEGDYGYTRRVLSNQNFLDKINFNKKIENDIKLLSNKLAGEIISPQPQPQPQSQQQKKLNITTVIITIIVLVLLIFFMLFT